MEQLDCVQFGRLSLEQTAASADNAQNTHQRAMNETALDSQSACGELMEDDEGNLADDEGAERLTYRRKKKYYITDWYQSEEDWSGQESSHGLDERRESNPAFKKSKSAVSKRTKSKFKSLKATVDNSGRTFKITKSSAKIPKATRSKVKVKAAFAMTSPFTQVCSQ